ncbi:glutamate-cysteine ligase family protein [Halomicrobium urmianum]|uniref:glutamate-cysteine ligase family protein n=1 Tax=Halomicrobium urmianum TaxID=1586233 RepID=UPI001CDA0034|nr:glutamate-cysteine ligase family protein [Halomicrobium urmianum]
MNLGIEMEFWVVDESGRLTDGQYLADRHELIEPEFVAPLIEVKTTPHEREGALRRELRRTLQAAMSAAGSEGHRLVPLGTPLTEASPDATTERGEAFEAIYDDEIVSTKNCAGTHVHFERGGVRPSSAGPGSGDEQRESAGVGALNLLTALDPALALVSSSPYYCGQRREHCSRAQAYRQREGGQFADFCDLWSYVDDVGEWRAAVESAYRRFGRMAAERGVSQGVVADHFTPEDTVLSPVRLRDELPTVEWRAPDTCLPSQAVRLAFDVGRVVRQTDEKPVAVGEPEIGSDEIRVPPFEDLCELVTRAIELGPDEPQVQTYLRRMGLDPSAYSPLADQISGQSTITESRARDLRLAAADWLRADVATLTVDPTLPDARASGQTV